MIMKMVNLGVAVQQSWNHLQLARTTSAKEHDLKHRALTMLHHLKQLFIVSDMDLYFKAMLEFEAVSSQYPQDVAQLSF
jgi:hypothetical protein